MPSRRRLLQVGAAGLAGGLAGCANTGRTNDRCGTDPPEETTRDVDAAPAGASFPPLPDDASWPLPGNGPPNTRHHPDATGPVDRPRHYWTHRVETPERRSPPRLTPVLEDGRLYVADGYRRIVAVDAATGEEAWRTSTVPTDLPLAVRDETVYAANAAGLHALDVESQEVVWSFRPGPFDGRTETTVGPRTSPRPLTPGEQPPTQPQQPASMTRPVVTDDTVYVGTGVVGESTAYAVDRATGEERWSVPGGEIAAATDDAVYVYDAGDISSVAPADGTVRWTESGITDVAEVAVADGTVYGSAGIGRTAAFDAATGERLWRFRGETESMHVPSVGEDLVYVGSSPMEGPDGGNLYALDATSGELEWCAYLGFSLVAPPAVAAETVFVPQGDGLVQARDAADGTLRWQFFERYAWFTDAAVVGSALFVGSEDGELFAFGETDAA